MINLKYKYSKNDREKIFYHLGLAIKLLFVVGIIISILGYVNYKLFITLIGATISFLSVATQLVLYKVEIQRRIKTKRNQIIEKTKHLEQLLDKAEMVISPIREELSKRSSNTLDSNVSTSLNYLSLERLIETLSERLDQVASLALNNSETDLQEAEILLDKNLVFNNKSTKHLIAHEIPDMPPHTWFDSLNFLISKVEDDMKNAKKF